MIYTEVQWSLITRGNAFWKANAYSFVKQNYVILIRFALLVNRCIFQKLTSLWLSPRLSQATAYIWLAVGVCNLELRKFALVS